MDQVGGWKAEKLVVMQRAQRFDLGPLFEVLEDLGYTEERIVFESNQEPSSCGTLIESLEFVDHPDDHVLITLNMGFLGPDGPLPSYFYALAESAPDPEVPMDFFRFFDRCLLADLVRASYPERDRRMFADWGEVKRRYFGMSGVGSVTTLEWLHHLYFPELLLRVRRVPFKATTEVHALRLGNATLDGTGVLGELYDTSVSGFEIELFAEEELDSADRPWPMIVRRRLETEVIPLLARYRLPVRILVTVLEHSHWAKVEDDDQMGFERVQGLSPAPHTVMVFEGYTDTPHGGIDPGTGRPLGFQFPLVEERTPIMELYHQRG